MAPLFKGPIKLDDKAESMVFMWNDKKFTVGLEKFGLITVPNLSGMHLDFRMEKLNRVISFVNNCVIKNATFSPIYCIRYNEKKEIVE